MTSPQARPVSLSAEQVRTLRLRAQRLAGERPGSATPAQTLEAVCGVQAQELPAAALSVRARGGGPQAADVDRARQVERSVVRAWLMRGTLHLVTAADYGWLAALLGPAFLAGSTRRLAQMGLDEAAVERAVALIAAALAERGPLTRVEIAGELAERGNLQTEGQARIHLIYQAAARGILIQGPDRGAEPAYTRVEDWLGQAWREDLPRDEALARLALRYLRAYGPSDPRGLAAWSGLGLGDARRGWDALAGRLAQIDLDGQPLWMLAEQAGWLNDPRPAAPLVRLLPRYDTYLLGYATRDLALDPRFAQRINAGGGIIHPALLVDGRVLGTWGTQRKKGQVEVSLEPFEPLDAALEDGIQAEVEDIRRFLG